MNPDFVEAMNHSEESQFGIINKSELTQLIETAREAVEQERQMRQRLIDMYERQLKIQDTEIKRLQAELAREKAKHLF